MRAQPNSRVEAHRVTGEALLVLRRTGPFFQYFLADTNAYVLPPGAVYASLIYEECRRCIFADGSRLTQEIEVWFAYRINIAMKPTSNILEMTTRCEA